MGEDGQHTKLLLDVVQALGLVQGQNQLIIEEQARAAEGRKEMYHKLDEVKEKITDFDIVAEEVKAMKPDVADYKKLRQNVAGGLIVLGGIGALIFTALGFIIKDVWSWIVTHVRIG